MWGDYTNPALKINSFNLLDSFVKIMSGRFPVIEDLSNIIPPDEIPDDEIGFDAYIDTDPNM